MTFTRNGLNVPEGLTSGKITSKKNIVLTIPHFTKITESRMHPDISLSYGPGHAKMCLIPYANNKGAEQVFSNGTIVTL